MARAQYGVIRCLYRRMGVGSQAEDRDAVAHRYAADIAAADVTRFISNPVPRETTARRDLLT